MSPSCVSLREEMQIAGIDQLPARSDARIRVYNCACHHEMRLTVWATDAAA